MSPDNIGKQLVQLCVRTTEIAGALHIGINSNRCKSLFKSLIRAAWECVNADIAEAPECQFGFIYLLSVPTNIMILGPGRTVIFVIEVAVLIQNLRKGKVKNVSGFPFQSAFHIAGHFLPKINDRLALRRCKNTRRRNALLLVNFLSLLGDQRIPRAVKRNRVPRKIRFKGGVVNLAVIDL